MMSRKDYERAVEVVRDAASTGSNDEAMAVMASFVAFFRGDNPRFDRERFVKACAVAAAPRTRPVGVTS